MCITDWLSQNSKVGPSCILKSFNKVVNQVILLAALAINMYSALAEALETTFYFRFPRDQRKTDEGTITTSRSSGIWITILIRISICLCRNRGHDVDGTKNVFENVFILIKIRGAATKVL